MSWERKSAIRCPQIPRYARRTSSLSASSSAGPVTRDGAGFEDIAALRDREREARVLLDDEHRQAVLAVQVAEDLEQLLRDDRCEAERRFVEQHQPRAAHQRARDREHLLLAAAHAPRLLTAPVGEPRERRVPAFHVGRRRRDRARRTRRAVGSRRRSARRACRALAARARCRRARPSPASCPASSDRRTGTTPRRDHPRQRPQRRRLARAVRAEDHDRFTFVDGEVDAVEHLHRPVPGAQLRDLRASVTRWSPGTPR